MNSTTIETKWIAINKNLIASFRFVRISKECKPELNIGYNSSAKRCLILELPTEFKIDINSVIKENLTIEHIEESNYVVIQLMNDSYHDLFNDLVLSLYHKIKDIKEVKNYSREFIRSFGKWVEFFDNKISSRLSPEEIKGIYGELFVLNEFIKNVNSNEINNILMGWTGLYDTKNDFEFEDKYIEIKTKLHSKNHVSISSEYQLEIESGKELELWVVSISVDYENGKSIYDLLKITIEYIREKLGDLSILYKAIGQKNLTIESSKDYNNYRYSVTYIKSYNCALDNFPRLVISNIPIEISRLKYNLNVNSLNDFLIEEKKY